MTRRFLVGSSTGEWPRGHWFLVDAESRDDVAEHFSAFGPLVVTDLQRERPSWLTDATLAALSNRSSYRLGESEPSWLSSLLDHLLSGDTYRWYRLVERRSDSDARETRLGEFGSWISKGPGSVLALGRTMVVAEVRPADTPFDATLVLVAA